MNEHDVLIYKQPVHQYCTVYKTLLINVKPLSETVVVVTQYMYSTSSMYIIHISCTDL